MAKRRKYTNFQKSPLPPSLLCFAPTPPQKFVAMALDLWLPWEIVYVAPCTGVNQTK